MKDRSLALETTAGSIVAYLLWTAAAAVLFAGFSNGSPELRTGGLAVMGLAIMATLRCWLITQSQLMCDVFAAGRAQGRKEASEGLTVVSPRTL